MFQKLTILCCRFYSRNYMRSYIVYNLKVIHLLENSIKIIGKELISYQIDKYRFTDPHYMSCSKPSEPVNQLGLPNNKWMIM